MNRLLAVAPPRWRAREWHEWYADYLQSDAWLERRRLVLQRAHGICEGCRSAPASEIHHLSYQHVGHEFLWELVAICRECRTRWHATGAGP
jgi:hypothetical protein